MVLLIDIGNTHTHLGLANERRVLKRADLPTRLWAQRGAAQQLRRFAGPARLSGVMVCSVVPATTPKARRIVQRLWQLPWMEFTAATVRGLGIDYPRPETIGTDRLASALAARHKFGAPCVAIGFGTAVTFNVVDRAGNFIGGIIAPGLGLMARCLHEKAALLPEVKLRPTHAAIGRSTEEAMLIGAVRGFRGLVRELVCDLKKKLRCRRLPVVATGGDAELAARLVPEITVVEPLLTLEGLRLAWLARTTGEVRA